MLSLVPDVGRLVRSVLAVCLSMQITAACVEGCSCQFLVAIHNSLSHQGRGLVTAQALHLAGTQCRLQSYDKACCIT